MTLVASDRGVRTLRRLGRSDRHQLHAFLERDPIGFVYPMGWLQRDGIAPRSSHLDFRFHGVFRGGLDGEMAGATLLAGSALLFMATHEPETAKILAANPELKPGGFRVVVGPSTPVEAAWSVLKDRGFRARLHRPQTVFAVGPRWLRRHHAPELRVATPQDLDIVLAATLDMHAVETLEQPKSEDIPVFRRSIEYLIAHQRVFVVSGGAGPHALQFKVSICAQTDRVAQLEGVWVPRHWRRRGIAKAALSTLCAALLEHVEVVTLYVNDDNRPAIQLYQDALGFQTQMAFTTIFLSR